MICILCNYILCILDICIHKVPCDHIQCFFLSSDFFCVFAKKCIRTTEDLEGTSLEIPKSPCHFPTQVDSGDSRCMCFSSFFFF